MAQDDRETKKLVEKYREVRKLRKKLDFFILYSRSLEKKLKLSRLEVRRLKEILEDQ